MIRPSLGFVLLTACYIFTLTPVDADINHDLVLSKASRKIDLSSQLVKVSTSITLDNGGNQPVDSFHFAVDPSVADNLALLSASFKDGDDETVHLSVKETVIPSHRDLKIFLVNLATPLQSGGSVDVSVEEVFAHAMKPFPAKVAQSDKHQVLFTGNHYTFAVYKSKQQSTTITLSSSNIESYTKLKPSSQSDNTITLGPYSDVDAFKQSTLKVHFENNSPFMAVVDMLRIIEVSHWGNIAVEETYHIKHVGAELKGSFSRYDYQRTPAPTSIKSFKTILPAAAADVYYRDEIGNISTSHMLNQEESVELELRPRFPLFGGWQTRYLIGYNVPSYEYLYSSGNNYVLKMRFVDHIFDDFVIDQMTLKVILPEGSKDIKLKTPFPINEGKRELQFTYLDTVGRPVVVAHKTNVIEQHIQDFALQYTFNKVMLLQEPLLIVGAFYLLFLLVIIYVRMDFSISKDEASESKMRAAGLVEEVLRLLDRRCGLYNVYMDAVCKYKSSKDVAAFTNARKKLDTDYRAIGNQVTQLQKQLAHEQSDAVEKIGELQRKEHERKQLLDQAIVMAEKVVNGRLNKQTYVDNENSNKQKRERLSGEIEAIAATL
ncbi:dolichyl-diphosphooligosaccharide--protein glycosyltransferase subunit 1 [Nematostella vectensis]|uniref:dolichyl-diphosphooligosaccharide--protein glycosyltransferase subunit 1 n=1 Tax=Nematostella vectensis TaxID=45351 RepID=UPI0020770464|nr:dolichyl-diphosphooligosaccharide--protein glycosyltransferase subunit 1 [Nematostella vectensis]